MVVPFLLALILGAPTCLRDVRTAAAKNPPLLVPSTFQLIVRDGLNRPLPGNYRITVIEAGFGQWPAAYQPVLVGVADTTGHLQATAPLPLDPDILEGAAHKVRAEMKKR